MTLFMYLCNIMNLNQYNFKIVFLKICAYITLEDLKKPKNDIIII